MAEYCRDKKKNLYGKITIFYVQLKIPWKSDSVGPGQARIFTDCNSNSS